MSSRIEMFKQMLEADAQNAVIRFGLANEYLKAEQYQEAITELNQYLAAADDEGAAYGMLARAYLKTGQLAEARRSFERGAEVADAHGHPSMAEEYRQTLIEME